MTLKPLLAIAAGILPAICVAYPLDGVDESGIQRLNGYAFAQERPGGAKLPSGALLSVDDIELQLLDYDGPDFDAFPEDPELAAALNTIFRRQDPSYATVVVDISEQEDIRWAGLRPNLLQNPGSVGKILCMLALFNSLAEAFPDPVERQAILRDTVVRGGDWVVGDSHDVPRWDEDLGRNRFGVLQPDDEFTLSEWLDHAISASANGAGAVVWREAMLIAAFGDQYPVSEAEVAAFFRNTPKAELGRLSLAVVVEPLLEAGINTDALRQGSFWTGTSKAIVPGVTSYASPRELARFMFRMEQGQLVDEWSSLEMKKYLYITKRRYRYVYAPELGESATYFKSGSLYQCVPEEDFRCAKYMGNKRNLMNSVALVEAPAGDPEQLYIVALMSNVLRFNSAWDHSRLAAAIHQSIVTRQTVLPREEASTKELAEVGKSD